MDLDDYFLERSLGFIDDDQAVLNPLARTSSTVLKDSFDGASDGVRKTSPQHHDLERRSSAYMAYWDVPQTKKSCRAPI